MQTANESAQKFNESIVAEINSINFQAISELPETLQSLLKETNIHEFITVINGGKHSTLQIRLGGEVLESYSKAIEKGIISCTITYDEFSKRKIAIIYDERAGGKNYYFDIGTGKLIFSR